MDAAEAAEVLGISSGASSGEIRDAYRRRIRERHPDRAGAPATSDAALINAAYDLLGRQANLPAPAVTPDRTQPPATGDTVTLVDDDTVAFSFPAEAVFDLLLEVAHQVGDVTYLDPTAGLLEVLVQFDGEPLCSIVLTLQGRADRVEAFCSVEALDGSAAPSASAVVNLLVDRLRDQLRNR